MTWRQRRHAVARSRAFALLASGFRYPDAATFAAVRCGGFAAALADAFAAYRPAPGLLRALAQPGVSVTHMQAAYLRAFEAGSDGALCPPYEGHYAPAAERGALLIELKAFYDHFGLGMTAGGELEDHLTAELEFLHALAHAEGQGATAGIARAQADFLDRHPRRWLPAFAAQARMRLPYGFYRALVEVTAGFVTVAGP